MVSTTTCRNARASSASPRAAGHLGLELRRPAPLVAVGHEAHDERGEQARGEAADVVQRVHGAVVRREGVLEPLEHEEGEEHADEGGAGHACEVRSTRAEVGHAASRSGGYDRADVGGLGHSGIVAPRGGVRYLGRGPCSTLPSSNGWTGGTRRRTIPPKVILIATRLGRALRALRDPLVPRCGRDGRGLSGPRPAPRPRGRDQGDRGRRAARARPRPALRAGGPGGGRARAPRHPRRPRRGDARRAAVRRVRAARGRDPAGPPPARPAAAAQGRRAGRADRPGPRRGPRLWRRPPRPQAREPLPEPRRPGEDPRLRSRQAGRAGRPGPAGRDGDGSLRRDPGLRRAGAGARGGGRPAGRHLRPRRRALRDGDGPEGLRRRDGRGHALGRPQPRAAADGRGGRRRPRGDPAGARTRGAAVPREGVGGALPVRSRRGLRPRGARRVHGALLAAGAPPTGGRRRVALGIAAVLVAGAAAIGGYLWGGAEQQCDRRGARPGPFRRVPAAASAAHRRVPRLAGRAAPRLPGLGPRVIPVVARARRHRGSAHFGDGGRGRSRVVPGLATPRLHRGPADQDHRPRRGRSRDRGRGGRPAPGRLESGRSDPLHRRRTGSRALPGARRRRRGGPREPAAAGRHARVADLPPRRPDVPVRGLGERRDGPRGLARRRAVAAALLGLLPAGLHRERPRPVRQGAEPRGPGPGRREPPPGRGDPFLWPRMSGST